MKRKEGKNGVQSEMGLQVASSDGSSEEYLRVNNCGIFCTRRRDYTVRRPEGRQDYQLIFVQQGCILLLEEERERPAEAGSLVLYRPGEPQYYRHLAAQSTETCWIHFTGSAVPRLLAEAGLVHRLTRLPQPEGVLEQLLPLIRELRYRQDGSSLGCLAHLLSLLERFRQQLSPTLEQTDCRRLDGVLQYMNLHREEPLTLKRLAGMCHLSPTHFSHLFTAYLGEPPHSYLIRLRMEQAKKYLLSTHQTVSEIAALVGYDNPLYFSRLFKKHEGVSPLQYRQKKGL